MQTPNEIAAAILLQTIVDHHPHLQAQIREEQSEPESIASALLPYYKAILEEMKR